MLRWTSRLEVHINNHQAHIIAIDDLVECLLRALANLLTTTG
ncbi:Uncharacterised protein [Vibrio cholerae]|nr:Uncharacterised protein [Vibrio cholerae]CSI88047.1 Uncharacterised protein [Vibrio cholerae]